MLWGKGQAGVPAGSLTNGAEKATGTAKTRKRLAARIQVFKLKFFNFKILSVA